MQLDSPGLETCELLFRHVLLKRGFDIVDYVVVRNIDPQRGLVERYAGFKTRKEIEQICLPVLKIAKIVPAESDHRYRHEDLPVAARCCSAESFGRDSNDRHQLSVER